MLGGGGRQRNRLGRLSLAVLLVCAIAPSGAAAATTIGSDLSLVPTVADACGFPPAGGPCTALQNLLPGGGVVQSQSSGVVTRWRVRANPQGVAVAARLTVVDQVFRTQSMSVPQALAGAGDQTFTFATRQPIRPDDQIAVDLGAPADQLKIVSSGDAAGSRHCWWDPHPVGSGPTQVNCLAGGSTGELLYNVDIEPDADCDGYGDETQDPLLSGGCLPAKPGHLLTRVVTTNGRSLTLSFSCALPGGNCRDLILVKARRSASGLLGRHRNIGAARLFLGPGSSGSVRVPVVKRARRALTDARPVPATVEVGGQSNVESYRLRIRAAH
jgi:hypothetical protein